MEKKTKRKTIEQSIDRKGSPLCETDDHSACSKSDA